jgi:protein involved in polysaccharide export with SLBB domain
MRRLTLLLFVMFSPLQVQAQAPGPADLSTALQYGLPPNPALTPGAPGVPALPPGAAAKLPGRQAEPAPAEALPPGAQPFDYSANLKSDVFGAQLFTGNFANQRSTQFNPDYAIAVGDRIQLRLWGGIEHDTTLVVDPQGNVFLPQVGPVKVLGVRNRDLQKVMESAIRKVFRSNVYSYASLAAAQPVRVFVGGFVNRPGLYNGTSMDSPLNYLDQAGGIDPERGSFLDVQVKRGEQIRAKLNLYDFLLRGHIPLVQLADGDVIFVPPRQNTVKAGGLAENAKRFEFKGESLSLAELARLAKPKAQATNVRVTRNTGSVRNVEYYELANTNLVTIGNGDEVDFTADKRPGTITVRVEGEHRGAQEYVLPYGSKLGELMRQVQFSANSDSTNIQLFRVSVKERQKVALDTSLTSLQNTVLTARSGTSDEARLRQEEADLILKWVERARKIEPSGQVLIAQASQREKLLLENGDIIKVPARDGLVLVSGEVLFPNAIAYDTKLTLDDYIRKAGGYTQNADNSRIVVAHRDGSFDQGEDDPKMREGDQVLVLPRVDVKSRQIVKEMSQILYYIAVSAAVIVGL